jgi:uncharacterized membrane protein YccF (DUF307 family)
MNGFIRCRWFVAGGWWLPFQHITSELVVNILQLMNGLDVWQLNILVKVEELAMWTAFFAVAARLPASGRGRMF